MPIGIDVYSSPAGAVPVQAPVYFLPGIVFKIGLYFGIGCNVVGEVSHICQVKCPVGLKRCFIEFSCHGINIGIP